MNENVLAPAGKSELNWLLDGLIRRLAGAEAAVALSGDGLLLGRSATVDRDRAERLAAMSSAYSSLSRGVGAEFAMGMVQQTAVELADGYLVVTEAGDGACLAVIAAAHADLGMVAYEMNVMVQQVRAALAVGPRAQPTDASGRPLP